MRYAVMVISLALGAGVMLAGEEIDLNAELQRLNAHYVGKMVTTATDLPSTDGGFVFVNDGELDTIGLAKAIQGSSLLGVESGGIGIATGTSVVIRQIKLKPNYIQFYVGTSGGAEWGKVLNTLSGYESTPRRGTKAEPPSGAVIVVVKGATRGAIIGLTAKNARPLTRADLSIDSLNQSLSTVIDTRNLASIEELSADQQEAIKRGDVIVGMSKRAIFLALGEPSQKQTQVAGDDVQEKWIYETKSMETIVVSLTNGVVTDVKRF